MFELYVKSLILGAIIEVTRRVVRRFELNEVEVIDIKASLLNGYGILPKPVRQSDEDDKISKSLRELSLHFLPALFVVYSSDYDDMNPIAIKSFFTKEEERVFQSQGCEINIY